jgi:hypothetical protein
MLFEGSNSAGQLAAVRVDDDGKILISGVTIDGDVTIGSEVEISNDSGNPVPVSTSTPVRTPSTTSTAASAESGTLIAANASRKALMISNAGTGRLYFGFASPATTANACASVGPFETLMLDQPVTGAVYGLWIDPNGRGQATEFV